MKTKEKQQTIRMLKKLIYLIEKDKVNSVGYHSTNYWHPNFGSVPVIFGEVEPKCYKQEITLEIGYKN
jgi:hypothetical protein